MKPKVIRDIAFYNFPDTSLPFYNWVFKTHRYVCGPPPDPVRAEGIVCFAPHRTTVFVEGFPEHGRGPRPDGLDDVSMLCGEYHFGGHFNGHFAHLLLDTVSTLWPDYLYENDFKILFFMHPGALEHAYVRYVLDLFGFTGRIRIETAPVRVETLHLAMPVHRAGHPGTAYLTDDDFLGRARRVVAAPGITTRQPLYLSRRKAKSNRGYDGEWLLERILIREGVTVVHPDTLTLPEHIALVASRETVVSPCGAACYPLFFSPNRNRLIVLDSQITPSFLFLKTKTDLDMSLVRCCIQYDHPGNHARGSRVFDLGAALHYLKRLGVIADDTVSAAEWTEFAARADAAQYHRTRSAYRTLLSGSLG